MIFQDFQGGYHMLGRGKPLSPNFWGGMRHTNELGARRNDGFIFEVEVTITNYAFSKFR
jgi:hypothetical protein